MDFMDFIYDLQLKQHININIENIILFEKIISSFKFYCISEKDGTKILINIYNDLSVLRIENYLHIPYSYTMSDETEKQISQDNKNFIPIKINEKYSIVFGHN